MKSENWKIHTGDCVEIIKGISANSVQSVITSPPYYGLRDYGDEAQIGLEETPDAYVEKIVEVFREVRRVLRDDGTVWLNIGDSYAGSGKGRNADGTHSAHGGKQATNKGTVVGSLTKTNAPSCKPKDLIGIPWMLAFALRADGWWLRQDIIWNKPNPMPESVTDRCTKAHEYVFLLSKSQQYYYDSKSVAETAKYGEQHANKATSWGTNRKHPNKANTKKYAFVGDNHTRNLRSVWTVTTKPFKGAHFAVMPEALVRPCVLAGSKVGDTILDPFAGSGTVGVVALRHGRDFVGCELNSKYVEIAEMRITESLKQLSFL